MTRTYELWSTASGNRVGEFESRDTALASVRSSLQEHGADAVGSLALGFENEDGEGEVIARGAELMALAQSSAPRNGRSMMAD